MIGANQEAAKTFVAAFRAAAGVDALDPSKAMEFDEISISATSVNFPGGLLAWPRAHKCTVYYAVAESAAQWRRLRPLLLAFCGPTLTSFEGWQETLLPQVPVESLLIAGKWHAVARLVPSDDPATRQMARRSFQRLLRMVMDTPTTTQAVTPTTSRLLSRFAEALNGNDRASAERVLDVCAAEYRVDALNLSFLRVQMLSHFADWASLVELPEFDSLSHTRKPPRVATAMLEALYQTRLSALEGPGWREKQEVVWREALADIARPLLRLPIPAGISAGACRLYAWQALEANPRRADLEDALRPHSAALGDLHAALTERYRSAPPTPPTAAPPPDHAPLPIAAAQQALARAEDSDTLATFGDALARLEALDDETRAQLLQSRTFRSLFEAVSAETGSMGPLLHWPDWLGRLHDARFTASFRVLQRAVAEWPATSLADSVQVATFAKAVEEVPDAPPASERLADALPLLAAWAADDPGFPRAAMTAAYEVLLYRLMLSFRRSNADLDTASILIRGLLGVGLSAAAYAALLDDCLALAGDGAGKRTVYWMLDVAEETMLNPAPDNAKRLSFWHAIYGRLAPLRANLSAGQHAAFRTLSLVLGISTPETEPSGPAPEATFEDRLAGRTIGIYTLTESAGRQASQAIIDLAPSVSVSTSADLVGSAALKALAQHSDIFIVATASAKHAATGFIQQSRPRDKPLLFASGRGFTSIIRALEEFLLETR